jgi:hypothetical protein
MKQSPTEVIEQEFREELEAGIPVGEIRRTTIRAMLSGAPPEVEALRMMWVDSVDWVGLADRYRRVGE